MAEIHTGATCLGLNSLATSERDSVVERYWWSYLPGGMRFSEIAMELQEMLYFAPSLERVLANPTRPSLGTGGLVVVPAE